MQGKDFSGQDLRGRSFKNQDLTGADFSNCDLRGVDFSGVDLTAAKCCNARMGKTVKFTFGILLLQLLIGALSGFLVALGNFLLILFTKTILNRFELDYDNNQLVFMVIFALLLTTVCLISVNHKRLDYLGYFFALLIAVAVAVAVAGVIAIAIAIVIAGAGAVLVAVAGVVAGTIVGAVAVAVARAGVIAIAIAIVIAGAGAVLVAVLVAVAGVVAGAIVGAGAGAVAVAVAASGIIYIILGIYLGWRALKKEESQLSLLRTWSLKFNCLGGTQFAFATLHSVDFSDADLKQARFKNAHIQGCQFYNAKNHHLALTDQTPLEMRKVRDLIIMGESSSDDFSGLLLQGLDFRHVKNLKGFNFANANLSFANFSHCDLQNANLSETNALATCFNETKMTGATIKNWNIDTRTQLQNIDCAYVYLDAEKSQRNPPEGEFAENEFSKIYQQIADTVDFIAHSREELDALIIAINVIKEQDGCDEIFVQNIERKQDSIVVKVKAPEGFDHEQIYKQIKKEQKKEIKQLKADFKLKLLEKDKDYLQRENQLKDKHQDLLADILKKSVGNPVNVTTQVENKQMKEDNSRTISNSSINNSNANLGDNSTLTNTIQQLPESDNKLKEQLTQLAEIIENSKLPDEDKQDALQETQIIAEAKAEQPEKQKSMIAKALRSLKRIGGELQSAPEVLEQYSEIIEQIGEVF